MNRALRIAGHVCITIALLSLPVLWLTTHTIIAGLVGNGFGLLAIKLQSLARTKS